MFALKLSFILLCACAANGFLDHDVFGNREVDNLGTNLFDSKENLDATLPLLPAVGRLPKLRKLVAQLDAFVKLAKKLVVKGLGAQVKDLLRETLLLARLALRLAREENLSAPLLRALNLVYRLAAKAARFGDVAQSSQVLEELQRLHYEVKRVEYLLNVPVLPGFAPLQNDLERF